MTAEGRRRRYEAADQQGWKCALCRLPMADGRQCSYWASTCRRADHADMNRAVGEYWGRERWQLVASAEAHAVTIRDQRTVRAAHRSCAARFNARSGQAPMLTAEDLLMKPKDDE